MALLPVKVTANPDGHAAAKLYQEFSWLHPNKFFQLIYNSQQAPEAWSMPNCVMALRGIVESSLPRPGLHQEFVLWLDNRVTTLMSKACSFLRTGSKPPGMVRLRAKKKMCDIRCAHRSNADEPPTLKEHEWFAWPADIASYLDVRARIREPADAKSVADLCTSVQDLAQAWLRSCAMLTAEELAGIFHGLGNLVRSCSISELEPLQIDPTSYLRMMAAFSDRLCQATCTSAVVANFMKGLRFLSKHCPAMRTNPTFVQCISDWLERITECVCDWSAGARNTRLQASPRLGMQVYVIMQTVVELGGCWRCIKFITTLFLPKAGPTGVTSPENFLSMIGTCKAILQSEECDAEAPLRPALTAEGLGTHALVTDSVRKLLMDITCEATPHLLTFLPGQIVQLLQMLGSLKALSMPFLLAVLKAVSEQLTDDKVKAERGSLAELEATPTKASSSMSSTSRSEQGADTSASAPRSRPLLPIAKLDQQLDFVEERNKLMLTVSSKSSTRKAWLTNEVTDLLLALGQFGQESCDNRKWELWNGVDWADSREYVESDAASSRPTLVLKDPMQSITPLSYCWGCPEYLPLTEILCDVIRASRSVLSPGQINRMTLSQLSLLVSALNRLQGCNDMVHVAAKELRECIGSRVLKLLGIFLHSHFIRDVAPSEPHLEQLAQILGGLVFSGCSIQNEDLLRTIGSRTCTISTKAVTFFSSVKRSGMKKRVWAVDIFNSATKLLDVVAKGAEVYAPEVVMLPKECLDAVLATIKLALKLIPGSEDSTLESDAIARLMLAIAKVSTTPGASMVWNSAATKAVSNLFQTVILATCGPSDPADLRMLQPTACRPEILADMLCACGRQGLHHSVRSRLVESTLLVCEESFHNWVTSWKRGQHWLGHFCWGLVAVSAYSPTAIEVLRSLLPLAASAGVPSPSDIASFSAAAAADALALAWVLAVFNVENADASRERLSHLSKVYEKYVGNRMFASVMEHTWLLSLAWEVMVLTQCQECTESKEFANWTHSAKQSWHLQRSITRLSGPWSDYLRHALTQLSLPFEMEADVKGLAVDALLDTSGCLDITGSWCVEVVLDADAPPDPALAVLANSPQSQNYGSEQARRLHLHRLGFHVIQIWDSSLRQGAETVARAIQLVFDEFKVSQMKIEQAQSEQGCSAYEPKCVDDGNHMPSELQAPEAAAAENTIKQAMSALSGACTEDVPCSFLSCPQAGALAETLDTQDTANQHAGAKADAPSLTTSHQQYPAVDLPCALSGTLADGSMHESQPLENEKQLEADTVCVENDCHTVISMVCTDRACYGDNDSECFSDDELLHAFSVMNTPAEMPEPTSSLSQEDQESGHGNIRQREDLHWVLITGIPYVAEAGAAELLVLGGVKGVLGIEDDRVTFCCQESLDFQDSQYFLGFQVESDMRLALSACGLRYLGLCEVDTPSQPSKRQRSNCHNVA